VLDQQKYLKANKAHENEKLLPVHESLIDVNETQASLRYEAQYFGIATKNSIWFSKCLRWKFHSLAFLLVLEIVP